MSQAGALMLVEALLRQSGGQELDAGVPAMSTIEKAALAVAFATLHDGGRVWKTIDYSITERWHQLGWIEDPRGGSKSMVLTAEGVRLARELHEQLVRGGR